MAWETPAADRALFKATAMPTDADYAALEKKHGFRTGTLKSLVNVESRGNPYASSPAGAFGSTQFMPETARENKIDLTDPKDQLRGAAEYLASLKKQYKGDEDKALAHYNGGAVNAAYHGTGKEPPISDVSAKNAATNRKYVKDVNAGIIKPTAEAKVESEGTWTTPEAARIQPTAAASSPTAAAPPSFITPASAYEIPSTQTIAEQAAAKSAIQPSTNIRPFWAPESAALGAVNAYTAGTEKYPAAALAAGIDKAQDYARRLTQGSTGYRDSLTYQQAANFAVDTQRQAQQQNPGSYLTGQVASAFVPGPKGAAVLGPMGQDAARGAVSGFTANKYTTAGDAVQDAGLGAGLSVVGGTIARAIPAVQKAVIKKNTMADLTDLKKNFTDQAKALKEEIFNAYPKARTLKGDKLVNFLNAKGHGGDEAVIRFADLQGRIKQSQNAIDALPRVDVNNPEYTKFTQFLADNSLKREAKTGWDIAKGAVVPTIVGGATGYGAGMVIPGADPLSMALLGAGGGGGWQMREQLSNVGGKALGAINTRVPAEILTEPANRFMSNSVMPEVIRRIPQTQGAVTLTPEAQSRAAQLQQLEQTPFTPEAEQRIMNPDSPLPIGARTRRLADEFRAYTAEQEANRITANRPRGGQ